VAEAGAFVPVGFDPPPALAAGELRLEPLGPQHNERDYAAWTSSMDHIHDSPGYAGRSWPHTMSLAENLADLARHAREFVERSGFTYTVLDATDDVVGCVYIYPCDDGVHDAVVLSWVRESQALRDGDLRRAVAEWLMSDAWPFARPLYEPLLS
jgi:RimJ/RimL family protein N-acetyltransferase